MQPGPKVCLAAFCLFAGGASHAEPALPSQAWFYSTKTLEDEGGTPERWCSFVTKRTAETAGNSERFEAVESGWLQYRENAVARLVITSQSEDAYVEDDYKFGPGLRLQEVTRTGHYYKEPLMAVTFRPNSQGLLTMTAASRLKVKAWKFENYFFDWPIYQRFSAIPFASLISMKPRVSVVETCKAVRR